jgi:toxic protein SymE
LANKKNIKTNRQLKVVSKYQPRDYHQYVIVPEIRLVGKWLRESGFEEGKYVLITVENNKLTITLNEEKADNKVYSS